MQKALERAVSLMKIVSLLFHFHVLLPRLAFSSEEEGGLAWGAMEMVPERTLPLKKIVSLMKAFYLHYLLLQMLAFSLEEEGGLV